MHYRPDRVINVVGLSGSGKSTLIHDTFGDDWTVVRPSDVLRENAERVGVHITQPADYVEIHRRLEVKNPNFMVERILGIRGNVVLDGLRVYRHVVEIAKAVGEHALFTTYVTCDDEQRLQRVQNRSGRPESAPQSVEELRARDVVSIPEDYEFDRVRAMANLPYGSFDTSGNRTENAAQYGMLIRSFIKAA